MSGWVRGKSSWPMTVNSLVRFVSQKSKVWFDAKVGKSKCVELAMGYWGATVVFSKCKGAAFATMELLPGSGAGQSNGHVVMGSSSVL
mmetsp:Transcript_114588/g.222500  ORF Transcript_114588/g.222500 Transcript_114588/m.222500 type:complete len:88 (+) Transcript_114588:2235-2498(+)